MMGVLLLGLAGLLVGHASNHRGFQRVSPLVPEKLAAPWVVGLGAFSLVVGALMGITSVGSGSLIILSMLYLFTLPASKVVGTNIIIALMMILPAAVTHLGLGGVTLRVVGLLLVGSIVGAMLGSKTTVMIPDGILRFAIALVVASSGSATFAKVLVEMGGH